MTSIIKQLLVPLLLIVCATLVSAQEVLTMQQALDFGQANYGSIKSKTYQMQNAEQSVSQSRRDYIPNVVLSAQQVYGTVNGQNGPAYGFGGLGVASSGLPLPDQNWNAAFGALYLANINWEVFSFGRAHGRVEVARAGLSLAESDLAQERFQHQVRVAAAYLNVLATQRLAGAQEKNFQRTRTIQQSIVARAKNGLVAGVDSALANAEVANAKISLLRALDLRQEEEQKFALLIGRDNADFRLDSGFVFKSPVGGIADTSVSSSHPVLTFYQSRVDQGNAQLRLGRKSYYPSVNLVGIFQTRASGFEAQYAQDQTAFSHSYSDGISPTRSNYLIGAGLVWNLTSILRTRSQVRSFSYSTMASQADLGLVKQQLNMQMQIAETKFSNALAIQSETPVQVQSATDAYTQKNALYRNGLTTLVDVTTTLYALNRAETDRDLAFINVWQALLLKAAAAGDMTLFTNELNR